jgi:arylsulfatase
VSQEYKTPGKFKGGEIYGVGVNVGKIEYSDLNNEAKRAFNRD